MKYLTQEGLDKIKKELHELKTVKRLDIAQRLKEAKALGDLTENAEYSSAKEDQAFIEGKILELESLIKESEIIDMAKQKLNNGQKFVQIGSVIFVKALNKKNNSSREQQFMIVSSQEAQPDQGRISNESPLGKAFLDHKKDDIIEVQTPGGKVAYQIIKIN